MKEYYNMNNNCNFDKAITKVTVKKKNCKKNPVFVHAEQGVTYTIKEEDNVLQYTFMVPLCYDGKVLPITRIHSLCPIDDDCDCECDCGKWEPLTATFSPANWWKQVPDNSWILTFVEPCPPGPSGPTGPRPPPPVHRTFVDNIEVTSGSLSIKFLNSDKKILETFTVIKDKLDTYKLVKGDYIVPTVQVIFEYLKKYDFSDSIFEKIKNVLSEFFTSIALEQQIEDTFVSLDIKKNAGEITFDKYNETIQTFIKQITNDYGDDYVKNFLQIQTAIVNLKHLVK